MRPKKVVCRHGSWVENRFCSVVNVCLEDSFCDLSFRMTHPIFSIHRGFRCLPRFFLAFFLRFYGPVFQDRDPFSVPSLVWALSTWYISVNNQSWRRCFNEWLVQNSMPLYEPCTRKKLWLFRFWKHTGSKRSLENHIKNCLILQ